MRQTLVQRAAGIALGVTFAGALPAQAVWELAHPGSPGLRYRQTLAFDQVRARTVLFSGAPNPAANTWEWDGSSWHAAVTPVSPDGVAGHAMAYDSRRGVTVLFTWDVGGRSQLWEWNSATWRLRTSGTGPGRRDYAALAYDSRRGVCVLFGGTGAPPQYAETWEWDGTAWALRTPSIRPLARHGHGMAFDAARGVVVLFGGTGVWPALLNDTWEWDGTTWTIRAPAMLVRPPQRTAHRMVYDARRGVTVLYGGWLGVGTPLNDTWEWDGAAWTQRLPALGPPPMFEYGMAYDSVRGVTVVHAGSFTEDQEHELWEWDGQTWTPRVTGPLPSYGAAMVWDDARARAVLFGGVVGGAVRNDTWLWDGAAWQKAVVAAPPPPRSGGAMVWDPVRSVVVLFGGSNTLDDTWEWDGTSWNQRFPATRPSPRFRHAMAFDPLRQRTLLFGGINTFGFGLSLDDTWEWDGINWTQVPAAAPPPRHGHAMAWDPRWRAILLFGGETCSRPFGQGCVQLADTWVFDGTTWSQLSPPTSPAARANHVLALDPFRSKLVLHGGFGPAGNLAAVWEWNGVTWTPTLSGGGPEGRSQHAAAFDARRGRMLVFGGGRNDLWEYAVGCDVFAPGHTSGSVAITCSSPRIGAQLCVAFSDPPAGGARALFLATEACRTAPVALGPPITCVRGWLFALPGVALVTTNEPALFCLLVPSSPSLIGAPLCFQGASLRNGACLQLTDALSIVVQP